MAAIKIKAETTCNQWANRCQEVEAYLEPLHHENATLRDEREEWTQFVTQLQKDHDALVAEVAARKTDVTEASLHISNLRTQVEEEQKAKQVLNDNLQQEISKRHALQAEYDVHVKENQWKDDEMRKLREKLSKTTLPSKPPVAICGVGLVLGSIEQEEGSVKDARAGWIVIQSILQGSPAEDCNALQQHDHIRKVEGNVVDGHDVEAVFKKIRGLQNTDVTLEIGRGSGDEKVFSVTLTRKPHTSQPPRFS